MKIYIFGIYRDYPPIALNRCRRLKGIRGRYRGWSRLVGLGEKGGWLCRLVSMGLYVAGLPQVSQTHSEWFQHKQEVADWATELLEPKSLVYEKKKEESSMTEEEERELAELMSDDE